MPLAQALAEFQTAVTQCDSLITNAHKTDASGAALFPVIDREQITSAAFLNMFIAWEEFLEKSILNLMTGQPTIKGNLPVKYVSPKTVEDAHNMLKGTSRHFDYANHSNVRMMARLYFDQGIPYESPLASIDQDLQDLKTIRVHPKSFCGLAKPSDHQAD